MSVKKEERKSDKEQQNQGGKNNTEGITTALGRDIKNRMDRGEKEGVSFDPTRSDE